MSKALSISHLGKKYSIGANTNELTLADGIKSILFPSRKQKEFWALRDISFDVNHGEIIGIIGQNGAGKSTLLKVLSRITNPTEGRVEIDGRLASLLEVGTGFHPELTGRENIYLNGTILGMTRSEINKKFDEIVDFSAIEKFLDTPVKRYSSGMYVRLAFAVAAHLEPEILVIDEVLAVGDAEFQKKCLGKMGDVAKSGRTVIFVSHNMGLVKQLCNKGVVLHKGELMYSGEMSQAISFYEKNNRNLMGAENSFEFNSQQIAYISYIAINNSKGAVNQQILFQEPFSVVIEIKGMTRFKGAYLVIGIETSEGYRITTIKSNQEDVSFDIETNETVKFKVDIDMKLSPGSYKLVASLRGGKGLVLDTQMEGCIFDVSAEPFENNKNYSGGYGVIFYSPKWMRL